MKGAKEMGKLICESRNARVPGSWRSCHPQVTTATHLGARYLLTTRIRSFDCFDIGLGFLDTGYE